MARGDGRKRLADCAYLIMHRPLDLCILFLKPATTTTLSYETNEDLFNKAILHC